MTDAMISISKETQNKINELAKNQGKTTSELVEEMVNLYINQKARKIPKSIGKGRSEVQNLSERVDELLWND